MHNEILARFEAAREIMLKDSAIDIIAIDKFIKKLLKAILGGNKIIFLGNANDPKFALIILLISLSTD
jgi:phosphoheptose isomerase